jgi:hypothetical protein
VTDGHQPLRLQLAIGAGDRVQVDAQVDGDLAHRRQCFSCRQRSPGNQTPDLVGHLPVDRSRVGFVDEYVHMLHQLYGVNIHRTVGKVNIRVPIDGADGRFMGRDLDMMAK